MKIFLKKDFTYYRLMLVVILSYYGLSSVTSYLSLYLEDIGFSGLEIGLANTLKSIVTVISPIIFSLISDKYKIHKKVFILVAIISFIMSFFLPHIFSVYLFLTFFTAFSFFQVALCPLTDGLILQTQYHYGSLRKWGSLGYALASLLTGFVIGVYGPKFSFYLFSLANLLLILTIKNVPISSSKWAANDDIKKSLKNALTNKEFIIIMLISLLIGMSIISNNVFFGLLYKSLGGSYKALGIVLFLGTIFEVPVMQSSRLAHEKFGVINIVLLACLVATSRWFFYGTTKSLLFVSLSFAMHGISIGLFTVGIPELIRKIVPPNILATSINIFSAVHMGLGGIIGGLLGGYLYEYRGVNSVYMMFFYLGLLGCILVLLLKYLMKKNGDQ